MADTKILIVDDTPLNHTFVRAYLAADHYDLYSVYSGSQALQLANELLPDVILLDVEMPGMTGWQVCITLKQSERTRSIPIVFLTASTDSKEKIQGLELGAMDYITKPFEPAELKARVRSAIRMKEMFDMLAKQAMIDALTGLHNRRYFEERLAAEAANARRYKEPFSCVICDVDHFKQCNDRFGHAFGDEVLRHIGKILRAAARESDVVCRYGGEEFGILLPRTSYTHAARCAERFRIALAENLICWGEEKVGISASFGVSDFEISGPDNLVAAANQALYHSKKAGRNRVTLANGSGFIELVRAEDSAAAA